VIGYPKSGNTWLSRLLGDALDSPVARWKGALPLATEGENRKGPHTVYQLHLRPVDETCDELVPTAWKMCLGNYDGERLVFVVRDPRDVTVSVWKYWQMPSLDAALQAVTQGDNPVKPHGPWLSYIKRWFTCGLVFPMVRYEDIHADALGTLKGLILALGIALPSDKVLTAAIQRQSFEEKRKAIGIDGHDRPYGQVIQLRNLRRGKVGDWKNHFRRGQAEIAEAHFGEGLERLGYEDNRDWWREVPE